jgi:type IV pilus assembly protein PilW
MEIKLKQQPVSYKLSNRGFTLVELLIGMVVALLAMGAIYSTFLSQHRSYHEQEEIAAMQQNLRAAMYYMEREIRMAGCDPLNTGNFGITAANANSITFTEDINNGTVGTPPDGVLQAGETITYSRSNGNLVRSVTGGGNQVVAQNIDALNFVYLDSSGSTTGTLSEMRSVQITVVASTGRSLTPTTDSTTYVNQQGTTILLPPNDNLSRRRLTTAIKCRNLGI